MSKTKPTTLMKQQLAKIALIVNDYDEAIQYYVEKLNFNLVEDTTMDDSKRWVVIAPPGSAGRKLLLAKAADQEQSTWIGNQTGGRVFLFLHTNSFKRDYQNLLDNNIKIIREPSEEIYGTAAVFEDLYGNLWDIIEPKFN